jgi:hypothetical protein
MNLIKWKESAPNKIFVFGDLQVKTKNSPDGLVEWWYHVAPIVEVNGEKFILDPAIEPHSPLKIEDWLRTMTGDIAKLEVAICGSGSYAPYDICDKTSDGIEAAAGRDQIQYLSNEWWRLEELRRVPLEELGDKPPWIDPFIF